VEQSLIAEATTWSEACEGLVATEGAIELLGLLHEVGSIFSHTVHVRDATPSMFGVNVNNWEVDGEERAARGRLRVFDGEQDTCPERVSEGVALYGTWQTLRWADALDVADDVSFTDLEPTAYHSVFHYLMQHAVQGLPDGLSGAGECP
jgi:hypothetical protein